jgi:hypothetical protein
VVDPKQRLTAEGVLLHPWVSARGVAPKEALGRDHFLRLQLTVARNKLRLAVDAIIVVNRFMRIVKRPVKEWASVFDAPDSKTKEEVEMERRFKPPVPQLEQITRLRGYTEDGQQHVPMSPVNRVASPRASLREMRAKTMERLRRRSSGGVEVPPNEDEPGAEPSPPPAAQQQQRAAAAVAAAAAVIAPKHEARPATAAAAVASPAKPRPAEVPAAAKVEAKEALPAKAAIRRRAPTEAAEPPAALRAKSAAAGAQPLSPRSPRTRAGAAIVEKQNARVRTTLQLLGRLRAESTGEMMRLSPAAQPAQSLRELRMLKMMERQAH